MDHPMGSVPAQRPSLKTSLKNIQSPVGYNPEFKPRCSAHAQGRNSLGFTVSMYEVGDTTGLGKPSGAFQQKLASVWLVLLTHVFVS